MIGLGLSPLSLTQHMCRLVKPVGIPQILCPADRKTHALVSILSFSLRVSLLENNSALEKGKIGA